MKSLVLFGSPLKWGRKITNPNVENVISIDGGMDLVTGLTDGYFWSFEDNPHPLNLYRIFLKDVGHAHYSYAPSDLNPDPLKVKAAKFITEISLRANDIVKVDDFLKTTGGISFDSNYRYYLVDLEKVRYDQ
jgi:hypothetical protein